MVENQNIILKIVITFLVSLIGIISFGGNHLFTPPLELIAAESITETKISKIVAAQLRFGFKLFQQIQTHPNQANQNLVIAPYSIAQSLAMMRNGTSSSTLEEINKTLNLSDLEPSTIDNSYQKLLNTLKTSEVDVQIAIATSVWLNQNVTFKQQFVNDAQQYYQAQVTNLNFANPTAKNIINKWVEQQTVNKIPQIVDQISPNDAVYLINATYFKGNWTKQFDPTITKPQPFYSQPNIAKPQPMMQNTGKYGYYEHQQFQAIRLPYGENAELGMYIFLPKETSNLKKFNQQLNGDNWQEWLSQMRSRQGTIILPRFELMSEIQLKDILKGLGITEAFDPQKADFSPMTPTLVAIDTIKHKAVIEVSEQGTEAAGVTSIGINITSAMPPTTPPFTMNVNRPFFFAICDDVTETILFMGNVVKP